MKNTTLTSPSILREGFREGTSSYGRIQLTSRGSDAIDLGDLPSAIYLVKAYSADDKVIGIDKVIKLQ